MSAAELDLLLLRMGVCGWFPLGVYFLEMVELSASSLLFLGNTMTAYTPRFWCEDGRPNASRADDALSPNQVCRLGCAAGNWTFEVPRSHSMVAEWELICDRESLVNLIETAFYVGNLTGALLCGYLSDTFGRRRGGMAGALLALVIGLQVAWIDQFYYYVVIRFFLGIGYAALLIMNTYRYELFSSRHRAIPSIFDFGWTVAAVLLPWFSYLIPQWRTLCLLMYGFNLFALIGLYICPDSPPWLIQKGRLQEAFKILEGAAKSRGMKLEWEEFLKMFSEKREGLVDGNDEEREEELKNFAFQDAVNKESSDKADCRSANDGNSDSAASAASPPPGHSFCVELRSRLVLVPLVISSLYWSYLVAVYILVGFSYANLPGDRYLNFSLIQLMEFPARILGAFVCQFVNRRPSMGVGFAVIGAAFLTLATTRLAVDDIDAAAPSMRTAFSMIITSVASLTWLPYGLWKQETFSTLNRGRCIIVSMLLCRVVIIGCSYLSYFQRKAPLAVEATLGAIGVVLAILTAAMTETLGKPLPQSLADVERMSVETKRDGFWGRRRRRRSDEYSN